jgi:hypothetical protein
MREVLAGALVVPFVLAAASTPADRSDVVFSFSDPRIVESSGLAVVGGLVVTTNDSGDSGRVFTVDPATGDTVGTTQWAAEATDVEALAPDGDGAVWVADIGDNTGGRDSVTVTRVPVGRREQTSDAPAYELVYPDGAHDAESLLADPRTGRLYVVTKEIFGGTFYAAPGTLSADRPNRLRRLGGVGDALSLATDAAFFPDGRHLVVRGYTVARIYEFPSLAAVADRDLPRQRQGEGIAVDQDGGVLLSSEGLHSAVLQLHLPHYVRDVVSPSPSSPSPSSPAPSTEPSPSAPADPPATSADTTTDTDRPAWPWLVSGLVGVGVVAVLVRSLRPR